MAGIQKGKDIIDGTISNDKLRDVKLHTGNLNESDLEIPIEDLNIQLVLQRIGTSTAQLGISSISGTSVVSVNRISFYDTSSIEGYTNNALTCTDVISYVIDGLVYTNSNDISRIEFSQDDKWYQVKYFCSNNGTNAKVLIVKQY